MLSDIQNPMIKIEELLQSSVNSENKLLKEICLYSIEGEKESAQFSCFYHLK